MARRMVKTPTRGSTSARHVEKIVVVVMFFLHPSAAVSRRTTWISPPALTAPTDHKGGAGVPNKD